MKNKKGKMQLERKKKDKQGISEVVEYMAKTKLMIKLINRQLKFKKLLRTQIPDDFPRNFISKLLFSHYKDIIHRKNPVVKLWLYHE